MEERIDVVDVGDDGMPPVITADIAEPSRSEIRDL
jgi:hypothetical protein